MSAKSESGIGSNWNADCRTELNFFQIRVSAEQDCVLDDLADRQNAVQASPRRPDCFLLLAFTLALALICSAGAMTHGQNAYGQDASLWSAEKWGSRDFWRSVNGGTVSEAWQFSNGEISLVEPRKGGNIITPPLPPNFELSWKWKIDKGVNSGLKYRVRRFGKSLFNNRYLGLEYQIIDSRADSTSMNSTAAVYALAKPKADKTLQPPGVWNDAKVIAIGDSIEHYLNGQKVAATNTTGPAWETSIALSKFVGCDDFGSPKMGDRIMLTDHGGKVWYKDFVFLAKPEPIQVDLPRTGPFLCNATRNGWADQKSIVIWTRTTQNPQMNVEGKRFVQLNGKQAAELEESGDAAKMLDAQLAEGATLDDMFGACPGATGRVRLSWYPTSQRNKRQYTPWLTTEAKSDFTAQWKIKDLLPNRNYSTVVEAQTLDGQPSAVLTGGFRTAPESTQRQPLSFCVTTCHDFIRRDDGMQGHKIYSALSRIAPDFIVHAGDIEYYDKPAPWAMTKELMRFKWGRIFALPKNREFYNRTTSYFIKDDHDTLKNDCWPGQRYGAVTFEQGVQLFNEEQFPSCEPRYANIRWGRDLEIWILEGRDFRSPNNMPDGPDKTILGSKQKDWLFTTLNQSEARFKLIFSPTPIVGPDRRNKNDNHANDVFAHEGKELRRKLSDVPGVIVFCGDRHWQYASVDDNNKLWEFGCGPGSEKHQLGWKPGDRRPEHRFLRVKGGFLSGELSYSDDKSKLCIQHHSVDGESVSEFRFPH